MKNLKNIVIVVSCLFWAGLKGAIAVEPVATSKLTIGIPEGEEKENLIEKKKTEDFHFSIDKNGTVKVENNFGDVKFKTWDKNEAKMEVSVTANAVNDGKANAFLDAVGIKTSQAGNTVIAKTSISCSKIKYSDNVTSDLKKEESNFLKVDYLIYVPKGLNITVVNEHGDILIPSGDGEIHVTQKYGTLYMGHINNLANIIDLKYGKAFIKSIKGGQLLANKMDIVIDKARDIEITNTFGSVKLNYAENIVFDGKYTSGYVAQMKESCKFKIEYSNNFALGPVDSDVKEFELITAFADVEFPLCRTSKFKMSLDTKNTNLEVHHEEAAKLLGCQKYKDVQKTVSIGTNETGPSTIFILANHGSVKIK